MRLKDVRTPSMLARVGEFSEPLSDVLWLCDDMLDIMAEHVERPNAGVGERGALMEMRERVAAPRSQLPGSPGAVSVRDNAPPTPNVGDSVATSCR
jgi:hypothetical protein